MTKTLLLLTLLATAVAMPLWMARCRKRGRRWVLPWLATLLPLGVVFLLDNQGLLPDMLDRNGATRVLFVLVLVGLAAFASGALYLIIPTLLGVANEASLRAGMNGSGTPKHKWEDQQQDNNVDDEDTNDSMVPNGYCFSSSGNHYEPIDYGDEESDGYYRNGKPV